MSTNNIEASTDARLVYYSKPLAKSRGYKPIKNLVKGVYEVLSDISTYSGIDLVLQLPNGRMTRVPSDLVFELSGRVELAMYIGEPPTLFENNKIYSIDTTGMSPITPPKIFVPIYSESITNVISLSLSANGDIYILFEAYKTIDDGVYDNFLMGKLIEGVPKAGRTIMFRRFYRSDGIMRWYLYDEKMKVTSVKKMGPDFYILQGRITVYNKTIDITGYLSL